MGTRFLLHRSGVNPGEGPWPGSYRGGLCPACREEVRNPRSRHFRDPFYNCRDCGPGAAITNCFPFTRENTSYSNFELCEACRRESEDPTSRQYRSPSVGCPECGPQYWIEPTPPMTGQGDLIYEMSRLIESGKILAVKDQRAFRILARADDDRVLERLQRRQGIHAATLGIMVRDIDMARRVAVVDDDSAAQLQMVSSPRVVLMLRPDAPVAGKLLRGFTEVELMLPPEAVYEILFGDLGTERDVPLITVPAQVGVDVAVRGNEEARRILRDVVDALVLHDLDLFPCTEDWVMRVVDGERVVLRRSGADTDCPLGLPDDAPAVLGTGCSSQATAAVTWQSCIRIGSFVGELDSDRAREQFVGSARRLLGLFGSTPQFVAYDPESGTESVERLDLPGVRSVAVEHHHAHIAAVMAEHGIYGPVIGVSLDGPVPQVHESLGRGVILSGTAANTRILEALPAFRIPAPHLAARDGWRTALGMIHDLLGAAEARNWAARQPGSADALRTAREMLEHRSDCARVESFGRALAGIAELIEGPRPTGDPYAVRLGRLAGEIRDLNEASLPDARLRIGALLGGIIVEVTRRRREGRSDTATAAWAITALVRGIGYRAVELARLEDIDVIVAGGGGLAEPWVRHVLRRTIEREGMKLYLNQSLPTGDAGIALGQVWSVVAAQSGVADAS